MTTTTVIVGALAMAMCIAMFAARTMNMAMPIRRRSLFRQISSSWHRSCSPASEGWRNSMRRMRCQCQDTTNASTIPGAMAESIKPCGSPLNDNSDSLRYPRNLDLQRSSTPHRFSLPLCIATARTNGWLAPAHGFLLALVDDQQCSDRSALGESPLEWRQRVLPSR